MPKGVLFVLLDYELSPSLPFGAYIGTLAGAAYGDTIEGGYVGTLAGAAYGDTIEGGYIGALAVSLYAGSVCAIRPNGYS
jgi:hypothetical protein